LETGKDPVKWRVDLSAFGWGTVCTLGKEKRSREPRKECRRGKWEKKIATAS